MATKKKVTEEPKRMGRITAPLVNVRKTPGGIIAKHVTFGTEIEILEPGEEWVHVKGGYIRADLIEEVKTVEGLDGSSN